MKSSNVGSLSEYIRATMLKTCYRNVQGTYADVIEKYASSEELSIKAAETAKRDDYSCRSLLELCLPMLMAIAEDREPEDWITYVYLYTLSKSFPGAVEAALRPELEPACSFFLQVYRAFLSYEASIRDTEWIEKNTIRLLEEDEAKRLAVSAEYLSFKEAYYGDYLFEMMKLAKEVTGHSTLEHICGVHYLAKHIGLQLFEAGIPIDMGKVSGGAAGHDIGKYGCKESEHHRVPYLHYYYTDYWFKKHGLTNIGHIAVNHSTWDLELENLPIESLVLIYSDFRVKSIRGSDNKKRMCILSLDEAFEVIFNKLDNMTAEKKKRYHRVFTKIKDFESYMLYLGINVDLDSSQKSCAGSSRSGMHYSLMQGEQILDSYKHYAINHNIMLMHKLKDERSLSLMLEAALSEGDWKDLREYIRILEEYYSYLTQKQKLLLIKFLYGMLIHSEEDIRRHCAELMGALIASFDEVYRKELPADVYIPEAEINGLQLMNLYFTSMLHPKAGFGLREIQWISYSAPIMVDKLFSSCRSIHVDSFRKGLLSCYSNESYKKEPMALYMLEAAKYIPIDADEEEFQVLVDYAELMIKSSSEAVRISVLELLLHFSEQQNGRSKVSKLAKKLIAENYCRKTNNAEKYLICRLLSMVSCIELEKSEFCYTSEDISYMFLLNLKTSTHWKVKKLHIDLIAEEVLNIHAEEKLHAAMHFCNLLKVSETEKVRNAAGKALMMLIPSLTPDKVNDIAVELLRALEIEGYQFAGYIPYYLGYIMQHLSSAELEEFTNDIIANTKSSGSKLSILLIRTVGVFIVASLAEEKTLVEIADNKSHIINKLLMFVLGTLADSNSGKRRAALALLGKEIFGSKQLTLDQKGYVFKLIAKKAITQIANIKDKELQFLSNSAALNHLYRFINEYKLEYGEICLEVPDRIAFCSGVFDPFTLRHKEIVTGIRNQGYEVHLALDELAWQRYAAPNLHRRAIINITISDEPDVYVFPEDFPINIKSHKDLNSLKHLFAGREVYLAICGDAFSEEDWADGKDVKLLELPTFTDECCNGTGSVGAHAQKYITEHDLYKNDPQYKHYIKELSIKVDIRECTDTELLDELYRSFGCEKLKELSDFSKNQRKTLLLRDCKEQGKIIGASIFRELSSGELHQELGGKIEADYLYWSTTDRIALIEGLYTDFSAGYAKLDQIVFTEVISSCLEKELDYCIYIGDLTDIAPGGISELLAGFGFIRLAIDNGKVIFMTDMRSPSTLYMDLRTMLKEPYRTSRRLQATIAEARSRLMKSITALYPGKLLLPLDRGMLHDKLVQKICQANEVPGIAEEGLLGFNLCVPYGKILHKSIIPNTITKALHTEKYFDPDLKGYRIGASPYYLSIRNQLKTIASFEKPIILVDDLLSKGYRLNAIEKLLQENRIEIKKIVVGILSNKGNDLAKKMGLEADCAYWIPKLKAWFNESDLYPFIGGDAIWRVGYPNGNLLSSINLLLPYTFPSFLKSADKTAVYQLSEIALVNAIEIFRALEEEYQQQNGRVLTLAHLGDIVIAPRCPDRGEGLHYDLSLSPLHYLQNDLKALKRIEGYGK